MMIFEMKAQYVLYDMISLIFKNEVGVEFL